MMDGWAVFGRVVDVLIGIGLTGGVCLGIYLHAARVRVLKERLNLAKELRYDNAFKVITSQKALHEQELNHYKQLSRELSTIVLEEVEQHMQKGTEVTAKVVEEMRLELEKKIASFAVVLDSLQDMTIDRGVWSDEDQAENKD